MGCCARQIMRPPKPSPIPDALIIPARCLQFPPKGSTHSSSSSIPTVNHRLMGIGRISSINDRSAFAGTPNPIAPPDLMVSIASTSPFRSTTGLPLLPASIGIATCTIGRPSPNSNSRIAATTPWLTLRS